MMKAGLVPGLVSICKDAELREVVAAWSVMSAGVKAGIVALIRASGPDEGA